MFNVLEFPGKLTEMPCRVSCKKVLNINKTLVLSRNNKSRMSLSSLYDGVGFGGDAKEKENMGLDASQIGEFTIFHSRWSSKNSRI